MLLTSGDVITLQNEAGTSETDVFSRKQLLSVPQRSDGAYLPQNMLDGPVTGLPPGTTGLLLLPHRQTTTNVILSPCLVVP